MAVGTPTGLANGSDTTTSSSYVTASQSPTANRIVLAYILSTGQLPKRPEIPTSLSGNGLTWVCLGDWYSSTSVDPLAKQSAWAAFTGSSPSAGAVTITFPYNHTLCAWSFAEFPGTYLTSLTDAIRQVKFGESPTLHKSTELSFWEGQNSDNAIWTGMSKFGAETAVVGTGMTEIHEVAGVTPAQVLQTQYRLGTQRAVEVTWTTTNREGGMIGVELRAATNPIDWRFGDLKEPLDRKRTFQTGVININASGDSTILSLTDDKQAHIYGITMIADGTVTVLLEAPTKDHAPVMLEAGEGYRQWVDPPGFIFAPQRSAISATFEISCDVAVPIHGWVAYWEDDI